MKKILYSLFVISSFFTMIFINTEKVYAVKIDDEASGWYYERARKDGTENYSGTLKNYSLNGVVSYCIEPTVSDNGSVSLSDWSHTGLSDSIKERMLLIAYYGYTYPGHKTKKYRAATQCLLWEAIMGSGSWCKINTRHWSAGTNIDISAERKEINRLVSEHSKTVSFNGEVYKIQVGETLELTDTNNVLSNYDITAQEVEYSVNENTLTLKTNNDKADISFTKRQAYESEYKIFVGNKVQNQLVPGNVDPTIAKIRLSTYYGSVELTKEDSETVTPQGDATLKGAKYGIYNENDELIAELITDENGKATSEQILEYGEYYIKEISPSKGYLLDENKYEFKSEGTEINNINVKENVIKATININKYYVLALTGEKHPESNVNFDLYNSSGSKIDELTTDENGVIKITLPYGKYILHQTTTKHGFHYSNDIEINVNSTDSIDKEVLDNEITAKLKVIKIDKDTKQVIKRKNIKFKIYDLDNEKYICQIQDNEEICEFKTDENGIMITPQVLHSGKYKLVEVDQAIDGYTWNNESVEFTIDENSNFITDNEEGILFETKFENKKVLGNIEIIKYGEEVNYLEQGFEYNEINLSGVKIGLYQNNELIKEYTTNEEGKILIKNLELGKYVIKEISTIGNHVLNKNEYIVELKYKDQYTEFVNYELTLKNYLLKGNLEFTKTDFINGEVIPNTKIEIYTESNALIFSGITDKNGMIKINELPKGKYYLIESEASTGYVITTEKVLFEIKENGEIVKVQMTNKPIQGTLEFTKTDFSTSEPLPNTKIEIYTENDELIFSGITNEEGKIIIQELRYGKYYILEKEAPAGYVLNKEKMYFEILEDGEIVKCTMTNEHIKVKVPITELNNNYIPETIGIIFIMLGVVLIIYEEKKRK